MSEQVATMALGAASFMFGIFLSLLVRDFKKEGVA